MRERREIRIETPSLLKQRSPFLQYHSQKDENFWQIIESEIMMVFWDIPLLLSLASIIAAAVASPLHSRTNCRKTKIAVLGAGTAGIFAAVSLLEVFLTNL